MVSSTIPAKRSVGQLEEDLQREKKRKLERNEATCNDVASEAMTENCSQICPASEYDSGRSVIKTNETKQNTKNNVVGMEGKTKPVVSQILDSRTPLFNANLSVTSRPKQKDPFSLHENELSLRATSTIAKLSEFSPPLNEVPKSHQAQNSVENVTLSLFSRVKLSLQRRWISIFLVLVSIIVPIVLTARSQKNRFPIPRKTLRDFTTNFSRGHGKRRHHPHIIPPKFNNVQQANMTLRDFILHPEGIHLALAPAFFGFFAQFGAMEAWEEHLSSDDFNVLDAQVKSLTGCSAGAMTAVLLASGIKPSVAASFCQSVTLDKFADPPGFFAAFKGNLFHDVMRDFILDQKPNSTLQLQDGMAPVAITTFDMKSMKRKIITKGSMPLAARASACFPLLFQPVEWIDEDGSSSYLIDGGIDDWWGLEGLAAFPQFKSKRVVHIAVGQYDGKIGPSAMPQGTDASEVVSISLRNTPQSGPWALENGVKAAKASKQAMLAALDLPLYQGEESGHYVMHIDTTEFIP
mmetsp:Transcript_14894/g.22911  ORF Transcript_14894/g.22911 Transcript_14894/m.22911 type:complete len:521 (+) Transcript_14894:77-1639(+)